MKNIIIICTGNSCRSQIAHGYFSFLLKNMVSIFSAGIETHGLNQNAVDSMLRDGIDISNYTSNTIDEYKEIHFDFIITVCDHANESCPHIFSKKSIRLHKNFIDPSKIKNSNDFDFDNCRDEIKKFSKNFIKKYFKFS